jgi:hypothetical protein
VGSDLVNTTSTYTFTENALSFPDIKTAVPDLIQNLNYIYFYSKIDPGLYKIVIDLVLAIKSPC